jgi:hypothetical protein
MNGGSTAPLWRTMQKDLYSMGSRVKKLLAILPLLALLQSSVLADFSRSQTVLHPRFPGTSPFIIEIGGIWPTDCHPGEQKPVVESFDGHTVKIGFEIIIVHITCNNTDTAYRSLVDMSEVVRSSKPLGDMLDVQVGFQGETLEQTVELVCPKGKDCASLTGNHQRPEPGLYSTPGLANQGLLVATQNAATVIFPLVYDESGRSEWLFTGNRMDEDSFFSDVLRLSGGDCFSCKPTGAKPEMTTLGHLSVLVDHPGVLQVKVDDGLFMEYQSLVFGYKTFQVGSAGEQTLVDIEGRWGISENRGTNPPLGDLTEFFPGAFDIEFENFTSADKEMPRAGQVSYLVSTPTGATLGQLVCRGQTGVDPTINVCEFIDPTDAAEPLFLFYQDGPSSLAIEYGRALIAVGVAPGGKAVRLD